MFQMRIEIQGDDMTPTQMAPNIKDMLWLIGEWDYVKSENLLIVALSFNLSRHRLRNTIATYN